MTHTKRRRLVGVKISVILLSSINYDSQTYKLFEYKPVFMLKADWLTSIKRICFGAARGRARNFNLREPSCDTNILIKNEDKPLHTYIYKLIY